MEIHAATFWAAKAIEHDMGKMLLLGQWLACLAGHVAVMVALDFAVRELAYRGTNVPGLIAIIVWSSSSLGWATLATWPLRKVAKAPMVLWVSSLILTTLLFLAIGFIFTVRF